MSTMATTIPFQVDEDYDAARASDGISRYGAYVRQNAKMFEDPWDDRIKITADPADFAVAAWRVATGPIMGPGYVRYAARILSVAFQTNDHDGSLLADVTIPTPAPTALRRVVIGFNEWARSGSWDSPDRQFHEPDGEALAKRPTVLPTIRLLLPIAGDRLPEPASASARLLVSDAKASVAALVAELNRQVKPVLEALEAGA